MEYLTLAQDIKSNGDRHKAKGDAYLLSDTPERAIGSYKKAIRNWNRALDLGLVPTIEDKIFESKVKAFQDAVMYGTGYLRQQDGNIEYIHWSDVLNEIQSPKS